MACIFSKRSYFWCGPEDQQLIIIMVIVSVLLEVAIKHWYTFPVKIMEDSESFQVVVLLYASVE